MSNSGSKIIRTLVAVPGKGAIAAAGQVFRDGDEVVVVINAAARKKTPFGDIEFRTHLSTVRFPSIAAYEYGRDRMAEKDMLKYTKMVGVYKKDDDARLAPEMPDELRQAIESSAAIATRQFALSSEPARPALPAPPPPFGNEPAVEEERPSFLLLPGEAA